MTPHHNYASSKYKFLDKAQFDALYGNKKTDVLIVGGEITYKKLIIATHFPMLNKCGLYPLNLYRHRY